MTDPLFPSSLLAPLYSTDEMRAVFDDRVRVQRMLDFEAALARAEAAVGIVPASHAVTIAEACQAKLYDLKELANGTIAAGNLADPVIAALTAEVGKRSKQAAAFVHWGATSQDVIDTVLTLELRAVIDELFKDLDRATKAFVTLTGKNRRNMTVARTLLQQTLPMPFGLKLAGYAAALARSRDRLRHLRKEALVLQFGGAAGTLASLDDKGLDVSERLAAQLDLTVPDGPWHTHRDRFAELASALAILAGTCGKIARDVALLMQNEIAEAFEPSTPGHDDSSTPHRRNPVGAAAALSAAMMAPNLCGTILNAQLQEHERAVGAWQAEWATFPALALAVSGSLRAVVEIAEGLTIDVERMKANLEATGGLVLAEHVFCVLAEKLDRAEAQDMVGELIRQAASEKRTFKGIVTENEKVQALVSGIQLDRLFMPNHYQGSAQSFIDRLVASSHGRAVRRSTTLSQLTDPKMPAVRQDPISSVSAAASAQPAAGDTLKPRPSTAPASTEQVVAAASALIDRTISELTKPAISSDAKPAEPVLAPAAAPAPEVAAVQERIAAPAPIAPAQEPAATLAPPPASNPEPSPASTPVHQPAMVADAPAIDQPDEEPGALLEVFARAAEDESADAGADNNKQHKTA
jgi:3-carboxy-cis,cis-muconate cycloisomerase